jgi:hypothetical protein
MKKPDYHWPDCQHKKNWEKGCNCGGDFRGPHKPNTQPKPKKKEDK